MDLKKETSRKLKGRCWDGYEPVPGKKPFSDGSCREMSSGFAGSDTRGINSVEKEVELRLSRLDTFTEDFRPPGTGEQAPGLDFGKGASDNARFNVHSTDPMRLTLSNFSAIVNSRLKKLEASIAGTTTVAVLCGYSLMMGKRRDNGKWTLPGGGLNPGESAIIGAIRELREEAGIAAASLTSLGSKIVEGRSGRKVEVHCFALHCTSRPPTRTHQDPDQEVDQWDWIDITNGLPDDVKNNLQSPKNLLFQKLGLLSEEK